MLSINRYMKRVHMSRYTLCMLALVIAATLARLVLIAFNWPTTNSDEGNMGLLAMHVAYNGEHPIFFYGLPYMGPLEGYIAALLFRLLGVSLFALRLGLLPLFSLFLICMYYLTRLLYSERLALAVVVLFSFGSIDVISRQLKAVGEYPEIELFAALICLLVAWFALTSHRFARNAPDAVDVNGVRSAESVESVESVEGVSVRARGKRVLAYGFLGLVTGLALWVDFLILPFMAAGGLLLLLFCRRELWGWAGLSLLLGIIIGAFPLIIYNVTAPLDQNSINILLDIHHSGADEMAAQHIPWLRSVVGAVIIALPLATGANPLCPQQAIPLFGPPTPLMAQCVILQGGWGIAYLVLGIVAAIPALAVVWPYRRALLASSTQVGWSFEERQAVILQCSRLMVLTSAALTFLPYMISPSPATVPFTSARYLTCMVVAVPAVVWPLWNGLRGPGLQALRWAQASFVLRVGALVLIMAVFVMGTFSTFAQIPLGQAAYSQEADLVQHLQRIGATRIYSEYWTCNRLTFHSQERIICSALDEHLGPGFDRYAPYRDIVRAAQHPAYVFPLNSAQASAFERKLQALHRPCQRYVFDGYVVYQPATNQDLP